jgi:tetratricopeptide (TPR) repeat protein
MKILMIMLIAGAVGSACLYVNRPRALPTSSTQAARDPMAEPVVAVTIEGPVAVDPASANTESPAPAPPSVQPTRAEPNLAPAQASPDAAMVEQALHTLLSSQFTRGQKQAAWKQLRDSGKLDLAITQLEQKMTADPSAAEYPATLGQAYLKKCATLQDLREQGILAMQADKLFDTALSLDPSNWEARFTKAVALSFWPPNMNKGDEIISHFQTLIQQQESQPPQPHFAETYAWLGDQYQRSGHSDDALTVWERGIRLFPDDGGLKKKLTAANSAPR